MIKLHAFFAESPSDRYAEVFRREDGRYVVKFYENGTEVQLAITDNESRAEIDAEDWVL